MKRLYCPCCLVWSPERKRILTKLTVSVYRCPNCGETYTKEALHAEYARLQRASQVIANFYSIMRKRIAA